MITAIIQARMNSTRLPGKILKEVCGKPLLELLVERLGCCDKIDEIVVATTADKSNDRVEAAVKQMEASCFRGSEDDVLDRFYQAAKRSNADHVIRITADCPLIDPNVVTKVIDVYLKSQGTEASYDYVSNTLNPTFPDGLDVEIFSFNMLERLHKVSDRAYQREHVCTYMVEHPDEFKIKNVSHDEDLSSLRWTVDNLEDFELIKEIFEGLYPEKKIFYMEDILGFLERNPRLNELNKDFKRNEGFVSSLNKEGLSDDERNKIIDNVMNRRKLNEV